MMRLADHCMMKVLSRGSLDDETGGSLYDESIVWRVIG
jgi:hypothetical protein